MTTFTRIGKHFRVSPQQITVFGLQGGYLGHSWVVGIPFGNTEDRYVLTEVEPAPVHTDIITVIDGDKALGREHVIDHVLVSNRVAVRLFLEGVLKMDMFHDVEEKDASILIRVPLAGKIRRMKICREFDLEYSISTRDGMGNVV